jgi:hypothetical protein
MGGASPSFPTTRPSFVAGMGSAEPRERERAAEVLVRAYWRPVYKYLRLRHRRANEDAEDLTQGFFAHALEKGWLARFDARRGSFRAFLRLALDGHVANEDKARAREKRGGGRVPLALDFAAAEDELAGLAPPAPDSVEAWFEVEWRRGVFAATVAELERELTARGQGLRAELFRRYDLAATAAERPTYAALGLALGLDEVAVTNHLAAARQAFRELLLARLREETASEEEFRVELAALLGGGWT